MVANRPLAITCTQTGRASETFIRRHIENITPLGALVLSDFTADRQASYWTTTCPELSVYGPLKGAEPTLVQKLQRAVDRKLFTRIGSPAYEKKVADALAQYDVQAIMGEYLDVSFPWFLHAQRIGVPFYAHAHGGDVHVLSRQRTWQTRYLRLQEAAAVIVPDLQTRSKLLELGLRPDVVHVIPCGVDVPDSPETRVIREEIRCIAVGRLVRKKGPLETLAAFKLAWERDPKLRLDLVGTGPLEQECKDFVAANSLTQVVALHGAQSNDRIQSLLSNSDIFLQHSKKDHITGDQEGSPVSLKEAMAHALPVIATRHAGIPEIVVDGTTGYLVEEGDVASMTNHIVNLACNSDLRLELGQAGWQRVRSVGSWQTECEQLRLLMRL